MKDGEESLNHPWLVAVWPSMATEIHPEHEARVFGIATDKESLAERQRLELEILEDVKISGLNGVLVGLAADSNLPDSE